MACKIISRQGLNPHCPPHTNQWKFRVLTTAPPVKSLSCSFIFKTISLKSKEAHLWNLYSTSQAPYLIPTVIISWLVMSAKSASLQLCPTPCTPIDCSLPGYSVHGILQATILERVAIPPPGDACDPRIEHTSRLLSLLHWQKGSLPLVSPGKPNVGEWKSVLKTRRWCIWAS